jgi:NADPH:quinone reductase-like Zn-dependent oxidoreductase
VSQELTFFISTLNVADLGTLRDLMQAGTITPVIDREYPLEQVADALRHLETGRARGKIVVTLGP